MKLYLFFIPKDKIPECLLYNYESFSNVPTFKGHILYAYTTDKKLKSHFLFERKNLFITKTVEIKKSEFNELVVDLSDYHLETRELNNGNNNVRVLCTKAEYVTCTDFWHESVFANLPIEYLGENLNMLKDKYRKALEKIGLDGKLLNVSGDMPDWCDYDIEEMPRSWIWEADYWVRPSDTSRFHIEVNTMLECKQYNVFLLQFGSLFDV